MNESPSSRDRLAIALDLPLAKACSVYEAVADSVGYAKVGLSLFVEHGPAAVERLRKLGAKIFLDLKLHDIPNTVKLASERAGAMGVEFLTVHASGGSSMLRAAVEGSRRGSERRGFPPPQLLAVTVLTSLTERDLQALGMRADLEQSAASLGQLAWSSGIHGLVCSPREVSRLRRDLGPNVFLCTPGIRLGGPVGDDQARTETAGYALKHGSNLLVVGRPIYAAPDPVEAARSLLREVEMSRPQKLRSQ